MNNTELQPDWSISPGEMLAEILETKDLRQSELSERTGLTTKHINQIVKDRANITGDVAVLLERTLDVPASFWTRLEADWEAYQGVQRAKADLHQYRAWADEFDEPTLIRNKVISKGDDPDTRADKLLRFFQVASPDAFKTSWLAPRVSFRRSQSFTVEEANTALWLRLVERSAQPAKVDAFNPRRLKKLARELRAMTALPLGDGFRAAKEVLAEAGVVLTFVREVPGTRMLAATWWLASDRPVIGLTARQKRVDTLWFNLLHEVGHIVLHPRRTTFLDLEKQGRNAPEEAEADLFAETTLFPGTVLEQIRAATTPVELSRLAAQHNVGVSLVAGQYAFHHNAYKEMHPLRDGIDEKTIVELESISGVA